MTLLHSRLRALFIITGLLVALYPLGALSQEGILNPIATPSVIPTESPVPVLSVLPVVSVLPVLSVLPSPPPAPTSTVTSKPTTPSDLATLEYELLEASYITSKTSEAKLRLILSIERVINTRCFGDLQRSLFYSPPPRDKGCEELIRRALELDPKSPAALCARDGLDAATCTDAYGQQGLSTFSESMLRGEGSKVDLDVILDSKKDNEAVRKAMEKVRGKAAELKRKKNVEPEVLDTTFASIREVLAQVCTITRLKSQALSQLETPTPTVVQMVAPERLTPLAMRSPTAGPLDSMLNAVKEQRRINSGTREYRRERLVSYNCKSMIDLAQSLSPSHPVSVCYRESFYSPACIRARKLFQTRRAKELGTPVSSPSSGFEEF